MGDMGRILDDERKDWRDIDIIALIVSIVAFLVALAVSP